MPMEYTMQMDHMMMKCMKIKVPVVLAEDEAQVLVDSTTTMPELAKKIDHIDVRVMDLEADPVFVHEGESDWQVSISKKWPHYWEEYHAGKAFVKKVIVHGTLHKQIYYVNNNDDVRHFGEDIPFTKMIELDEPEPVIDKDEVTIDFRKARVDLTWDLVRPSRLQQTGVIVLRIKIVENRQVFVHLCPPPDKCKKGNLVRDPGLEQWVGNMPVVWGGINVQPATQNVSGGSRAALLGVDPARQAAIYQTVHRGIVAGASYRLCFMARRHYPTMGATCNFTLSGHVMYYDDEGNLLANLSHNWPASQVGDGFNQFCFDVGAAPMESAYAMVWIVFRPEQGNGCQVVVDDVSLVCTSAM
ncbi:DUF3794 domain-containing protein [Desulfurispora thermophila]|uniref:DUF3794 domain-containing protein n=1 Tax=Desulfurispora thermophila TaxID=265470 RepID=UPI00035C1ACC|nr:DUF3794 domain-containing protein [Desulfurispora thermophila]